MDVTERKQAENALKASEAKFRLLVETMRSGLIMGNDEGHVTYVNDRLCEMIGYTRDELLGTSVYD
ncbi:MAG: PAS domain-containing protein [Anaerolineae bacterium]